MLILHDVRNETVNIDKGELETSPTPAFTILPMLQHPIRTVNTLRIANFPRGSKWKRFKRKESGKTRKRCLAGSFSKEKDSLRKNLGAA
jgi:hypothetical protein